MAMSARWCSRLATVLVISALVFSFVACGAFRIGTPTGNSGRGGGSNPPPPSPPQPGKTATYCVSGIVTPPDSLSVLPPRINVYLESASLSSDGVRHFLLSGASAYPDASGNFNVCYLGSQDVNNRYLLIVTANDSAGNYFAPVILPDVSFSSNVGSIPIGGGLSAASSPIQIAVNITSSPTSTDGALWVRGSAPDPVNPGHVMEYHLPFKHPYDSGAMYFTTNPDTTCGLTNCVHLLAEVPTQQAAVKSGTAFVKSTPYPSYKLTAGATTKMAGACDVAYAETSVTDSGLPLYATPGASLTASTLSFTGCK